MYISITAIKNLKTKKLNNFKEGKVSKSTDAYVRCLIVFTYD